MAMYMVRSEGVALVSARSETEAEQFVKDCVDFPECEDLEASAYNLEDIDLRGEY